MGITNKALGFGWGGGWTEIKLTHTQKTSASQHITFFHQLSATFDHNTLSYMICTCSRTWNNTNHRNHVIHMSIRCINARVTTAMSKEITDLPYGYNHATHRSHRHTALAAWPSECLLGCANRPCCRGDVTASGCCGSGNSVLDSKST